MFSKATAVAGLVLSLILTLGGACSVRAESNVSIAAKFAEFQQYNQDTWKKRAAGGKDTDIRLYEKYRSLGLHEYSAHAEWLSSEELTYLFRAAWSLAFYAPELDLLDRMFEIFGVLQERDALDEPHIRVMYQAWVGAREWDKAVELQQLFPDSALQPIPEIREPAGRGAGKSLLLADQQDFAFIREDFGLTDGMVIIVGASPNCAFVDRAATAIESDSLLGELFARHGHWLAAGPQFVLQLEAIRIWNETYSTDMQVVDDLAAWPMLNHSLTPTFYVMRGDVELESLRGWTPETQTRLREIAAELGAGNANLEQAAK